MNPSEARDTPLAHHDRITQQLPGNLKGTSKNSDFPALVAFTNFVVNLPRRSPLRRRQISSNFEKAASNLEKAVFFGALNKLQEIRLFKRIRIYDHNETPLYVSDEESAREAGQFMADFYTQPLTEREQEMLEQSLLRVRELMTRRGADAQEFEKLDEFLL